MNLYCHKCKETLLLNRSIYPYCAWCWEGILGEKGKAKLWLRVDKKRKKHERYLDPYTFDAVK